MFYSIHIIFIISDVRVCWDKRVISRERHQSCEEKRLQRGVNASWLVCIGPVLNGHSLLDQGDRHRYSTILHLGRKAMLLAQCALFPPPKTPEMQCTSTTTAGHSDALMMMVVRG